MSHGIYQLQPDVNHLSQLSVVTMPAMSNRVGGVMQGAGVSIDTTGLLTLAPATSNVLGGVKIGSGVNVGADGTISVTPSSNYVLPPATSSVLGGVKVGTNIAVAGDGTISLPTTISGAIQFTGVVTASAGGITYNPNSGTPANTYKDFVNNVGTWELDASSNNGSAWTSALRIGGAGNVFVDQNLTVTGTSTLTGAATLNSTLGVVGNTILHNNLTLYSPDNSRTLALNQPNGADPSVTSSTAILNIATTNLRVLSGYQIQAWGPTNAQYGNFVVDSNNALNIGMTGGGNIIFNGPQVWGGVVNANTQNLSNVNTLTAQAATLNGGSFLLYGPSSKYFQVLPNDGTYADPRIYSNTGNIRTFCGMSFDGMVNFYTASNLTFGPNWQANWTPTLTANAGTITPTGWYYTGWMRIGPLVFYSIRFSFNASAAFNYLYATMPVTGYTPGNNYMHVGQCFCESGPLTLENLCMRWELSDHVVIQRAGGAGFAAGNGYMFDMSGFYRVV